MTLPPIPPSDSLYKFTAIGGLIIVVLSLYLPWKLEADLHAAYLDMKLELAKRDIEAANAFQTATETLTGFHIEADELRKEIDVLKAKKSEAFKAKLDDLRGYITNQQVTPRGLEEKLQQFIISVPEVEYAVKKLELSSQLLNRLKWISQMTLWIGIVMTFYGFWNWYFKFQVHQDRVIKNHAEQIEHHKPILLASPQQVGIHEKETMLSRRDIHGS